MFSTPHRSSVSFFKKLGKLHPSSRFFRKTFTIYSEICSTAIRSFARTARTLSCQLFPPFSNHPLTLIAHLPFHVYTGFQRLKTKRVKRVDGPVTRSALFTRLRNNFTVPRVPFYYIFIYLHERVAGGVES